VTGSRQRVAHNRTSTYQLLGQQLPFTSYRENKRPKTQISRQKVTPFRSHPDLRLLEGSELTIFAPDAQQPVTLVSLLHGFRQMAES
jgi:hypothetical protein